ncbi:MAG: hypothetical protein ACK5RO_07495 [Pseudobdellovibrionaceae bacterium]
MFSKKRALLGGLTTVLLFTGCGDYLRGKKNSKDQEIVQLNTQEMSCLSKVPAMLTQYFEDQGAPAQTKQIFSCLKTSVESFGKYTRGKDRNLYTAEELKHYFNRYLLKENQMSLELMLSLLKVKQVFLGGEAHILTRKEMESMGIFFDLLEESAQQISGTFKLITFSRQGQAVSLAEITSAHEKYNQVAVTLLAKSHVHKVQYSLSDFKTLILELDQFLKEDSKTLQQVNQWLPFAESLKAAFLGENAFWSTAKQWQTAARWVINSYFLANKYFYLVRDRALNTPEEWTLLVKLGRDIFDLIEQSPEMIQQHVILSQHIDRLIDEVFALDLLDTEITPEIWKNSYRKFLFHMIEGRGRDTGEATQVKGLEKKHLDVLWVEYKVWATAQTFINQLFQNKSEFTLKTVRDHVSSMNLKELFEEFSLKGLERQPVVESWSDWVRILFQEPLTVWTADSKVYVGPNARAQVVGFTGMNWMNAMRSWTRLTLRGYGDHRSTDLFKNRMSEIRMVQLEEDFREFGRAFGLLDPRQPSPAVRTFNEGNLFTFSGNGDDYLTATEIYELLSLMISGGRRIVDVVHQDAVAAKCAVAQVDVFNKQYLVENCFFRELEENYPRYFNNMPSLVRFLQALSVGERRNYFSSLFLIAKVPQHRPGFAEYTEIRAAVSIAQYVESFMVVIDQDQNQLLSEKEAVAGFHQRLTGFIGKNIELNSVVKELVLEDVFLYLLHEGKKPGISELARFKLRRLTGDLPEVGRGRLLVVLQELSAKSE